jgi:hypothetical protein
MKHEIPYFLRPGYKPPEAELSFKGNRREFEQMLIAREALGYSKALNDLREGLKDTHPIFLVAIEAAVKVMMVRVAEYDKELH